ncbi:hypothetical protein FHS29_006201 [Saccharothrix tamanrassetensis]|uniref:Uncharacterized protein n=1 Tax=Saccharothrix tamanrassetensis TaxID=1051531 RepID=A0A841CQT3_9PSEU|nr:hypothetical protein [Saccharothrix tamanrassetensis]MBB5959580.1 hypothetical protein [Saccharothrix tamanrassetensis]
MSADVQVVDLRSADAQRHPTGVRPGTATRLIVVDDSTATSGNHDAYQRIATLGHLRDVVLVIVGPVTRDETRRPSLRPSAALGRTAVVLWVGDERGIRWEGGSDRGRAVDPEDGSGLDDLLGVLRVEQVFDAVVRHLRQVPHQTASPAVDLVHPSLKPAQLRELLARCLGEVARPADVRGGPPETRAELPAVRASVERGSRLERARTEARQRLAHAARTTADLTRWNGAWNPGGRRARESVAHASAALEAHHALVVDAVRLAGPLPPPDDDALAALGVPRPQPVEHKEVGDALGGFLLSTLRSTGSLADTGRELRRLVNGQAGGAGQEAVGTPPPLRRQAAANGWTPVLVLLPFVLLTCLVPAWLPHFGAATGPATAVLWLVAVAFLLANRAAQRPATPPALAVIAAAAVAGVVAGTVLPPPGGVPELVEVVADVLCALAAVGGSLALWRVLAEAWTATLALAPGQRANDRLAELVDGSVVVPQANAAVRRRTADAAMLLAVGCDDVREVFAARAGDGGGGAGHPELLDVIRADLVLVGAASLDDYLAAIGSGASLSVAPEAVTGRAHKLLAEYEDHLLTRGVHQQPPIGDADVRQDVDTAFRQGAADVRRVLGADGREEMTQLCTAADVLRRLDPDWPGVRVVRFAPRRLRNSSEWPGPVVEVDRDVVGLLRLVPLRSGVVRPVQPTTPGEDEPSDGTGGAC